MNVVITGEDTRGTETRGEKERERKGAHPTESNTQRAVRGAKRGGRSLQNEEDVREEGSGKNENEKKDARNCEKRKEENGKQDDPPEGMQTCGKATLTKR